MNVKSIAKGLLVLNVIALVMTAAVSWFLEVRSIPELLDAAMYVALGMGALGALLFGGATSGSDGSTGIAASAADQPSRLVDALWLDRNAGISAGAWFVLGGASWLGIAWSLTEFLTLLSF